MFLKIPSEGKEAVSKKTKWDGDKATDIRKDVIVDHRAVEPKGRPYLP